MLSWRSFLSHLAITCSIVGAQIEVGGPRRHAVLVGIEGYANRNLWEDHPLAHTVEDAEAMGAVLRRAGYEVVVLSDLSGKDDPRLRPTKDNIERELFGEPPEKPVQSDLVSEVHGGVFRRCAPGDTVLVALAGHGLRFDDEEPDWWKDGFYGNTYFCPVEGIPFEEQRNTLLSMRSVYEAMDRSPASLRLLLVDASRRPGKRGIDAERMVELAPGTAVIYSCSFGQWSHEHDAIEHGVFFDSLIDGLAGQAAGEDGTVTVSGLFSFARERTMQRVDLLFHQEFRQHPELLSRVGETEVLLRPQDRIPQAPFPVTYEGEGAARVLVNSIGMRFRTIPAGTFSMGSESGNDGESPVHEVTITRPYDLAVHEVTVGQFRQFVAETRYKPGSEADGGGGRSVVLGVKTHRDPTLSWRSPGIPQTDEHPVTQVDWQDAVAFCSWLSRREGAIYRLPTEAEWEFAWTCRGRERMTDGNGVGSEDGHEFTSPVGTYSSNAFGLHDLSGNVWEWCQDWHANYPAKPLIDPHGPEFGHEKVTRGGSWSRHGFRSPTSPAHFDNEIGMRVVREIH